MTAGTIDDARNRRTSETIDLAGNAVAPVRGGVRVEVQCLRAIAVGVVVAYHLFPHAITGGFVGVDVFFAISGFLITGILLREIEEPNGISLTGFWARRVRRILPAALLVIAFCGVVIVVAVPVTSWDRWFADLRASALYFQNWHLASAAVDYFHSADAPSPVQHFWSLSIEEQFYVAWPLLLLAVAAATRRATAGRRRVALGVAMGAVTAASLAYSVRYTAGNPAAAYFATPARAWEFGLGGLLALLRPAQRRSRAGAAAISWLGLGAIATAVAVYSGATPFPGAAALLPVAGALAVMWAGMPSAVWSPAALMRLRPVQALGDLSYGVYLWHWPLIVFAPFVLSHGRGPVTSVGIIAATLALSIVSKALIEDPVRASIVLRRRPAGRTVALGLAGTACVAALTLGATGYVQGRIHRDTRLLQATLAHAPRCFGAASRDPYGICRNPRLADEIVPSPVMAPTMGNAPCDVIAHRSRVTVCAFGVSAGQAKRTIGVLGDSHAAAWRGALASIARREGWHGLSLTRSGCPFSAATPAVAGPARSHCVQWNREVIVWLRGHPQVSTVFVTAHSGAQIADTHGLSQFAAQLRAYLRAWSRLPASVRRIVVIRDTPKMRTATMDCLESAIGRSISVGSACAQPRSTALHPDPEVAAARADPGRAQSVDLTHVFCGRRLCYPVVGGALVFRDVDHLTPTFAATLGPVLDRSLDRFGRSL